MALLRGEKDYTSFVKGLITEANPLSFPADASIDESNFDLLKTGERARRLGLNYEPTFALIPLNKTEEVLKNEAVTSHIWETDDADGGPLSILVIQVGNRLWFFDATSSIITTAPLNGGNSVYIAGDPVEIVQGTYIAGKFVIANNQKGVIVLSYDPITDTVSTEARIILVRDIWGVDDGIPVTWTPPDSAFSPEHEYNLVNQGWGGRDPDSALPYYRTYRQQANPTSGGYPSNVMIVSAAKDPTDDDKFNIQLLVRNNFGTSPAPKGFFIIDAFRRGSSRELVMTGKTLVGSITETISSDPFLLSKYTVPITSWEHVSRIHTNPDYNDDFSDTGIKAVTSFAGRLWFAGPRTRVTESDSRSPNLGSFVFFSQVVDGEEKMTKCFSENDPTSEESPDPLDSDGGAIKIAGMQNAFKIVESGRSLLVFAENGIWEISGGETNFSATNFEIKKVTDTAASSSTSIVYAEGSIVFWAEEGIYLLAQDQVSGNMGAQNISETTIQTLFEQITPQAKRRARGAFDPVDRKIRWLYNKDPDFDIEYFQTKADQELVFDTTLQAFYKSDIKSLATASPFVAAYVLTPESNSFSFEENVTLSNGEIVVDQLGDAVTVEKTVRGIGKTRIKFVTLIPGDEYQMTVSYYYDDQFKDWVAVDGEGVDANGFLLTGYEIMNSVQKDKQAPYITCHFLRTETGFALTDEGLQALNPSSCILQAQWDFANSINSGKFGPDQQVYRLNRTYIPSGVSDTFDYGQSVITTKSKLRGRGRALSLLFRTEPEKDLRMYGWGLSLTEVENV